MFNFWATNFSENRNANTPGSMAAEPALVGEKYKDVPPRNLQEILKYYADDMHYFNYGIDTEKWLLTW